MNVHRTTFRARIMAKDEEDRPDTDCERDELGVVSDRQVQQDIEQLWTQNYIEDLVSPNGDQPTKSIEEVRDENRQLMLKALTSMRIEVKEYEC